jgi:hypothetical protein
VLDLAGTIASYGLKKMAEPVINCRDISKRSMKHNNSLPKMTGKQGGGSCLEFSSLLLIESVSSCLA